MRNNIRVSRRTWSVSPVHTSCLLGTHIQSRRAGQSVSSGHKPVTSAQQVRQLCAGTVSEGCDWCTSAREGRDVCSGGTTSLDGTDDRWTPDTRHVATGLTSVSSGGIDREIGTHLTSARDRQSAVTGRRPAGSGGTISRRGTHNRRLRTHRESARDSQRGIGNIADR